MANEHSNIVPNMSPTAKVADFKFWCQKVLPLVYDDSLSYYEVLNKVVVYLNQVITNINADIDNVEELEADFLLLQSYVNNFFDDIDQLVTYTERAEAAEEAANGYAASAAESATNASTSALNAMDAKDAAVTAKNQALSALASAQSAATSAAESATNAASSALTALDAKDAAASSALSASGSATNASASATAAQNSATLADAARTVAQSAATNAAESAQDATDAVDDIYAAFEAKTITDEYIISFDDGADNVPLKKLIVEVEPLQSGSGEPAYSNPREISGWTEATVYKENGNLFKKNTVTGSAGITVLSQTDYSIKLSGTASSTIGFSCLNKTNVKKGEKYTVKVEGANSSCVVNLRAIKNSNFVKILYTFTNSGEYSFTADGTYDTIEIRPTIAGGTTINVEIKSCLNGGNYTGEFVPNTQTIYTIPLSESQVYGADIDVIEGKLKINRNFIAKSVISEASGGSSQGNISYIEPGYFVYRVGDAESTGTSAKNEKLICETLPTYSQTELYNSQGSIIGCAIWWTNNIGFSTGDTTITTIQQFKDWWDTYGGDIVYPTEEETIEDIQPSVIKTLFKYNNIYANTGKIKRIEYYTLNNSSAKIELTKAMIAKELPSFVADTSLVPNDFRIIENELYKITANIASGGTIIPSTNAVKTTIGAELKSLLNI